MVSQSQPKLSAASSSEFLLLETQATRTFLRQRPNPSIERTNNGGSSFRAFASAQPPLFASHLKR
jgi:hypothetical protein